MDDIRLSHNELLRVLRHVFQALFGHTQDRWALADQCLWLETHGFDGVQNLVTALASDRLRPAPYSMIHTDNSYVVDLTGGCLLMAISGIIDLSVAETRETGSCRIFIKHGTDLTPLIYAEACLQEMGLNAHSDLRAGTLTSTLSPRVGDACRELSKALDRHAQSLIDGVLIDRAHYDALKSVASGILVPASETSRRGAGE